MRTVTSYTEKFYLHSCKNKNKKGEEGEQRWDEGDWNVACQITSKYENWKICDDVNKFIWIMI
jgi:hypothetical protein